MNMPAIVLVALATVLTGCNVTRSSVVMVGTRHPAVDPASVQVYFDPPKTFSKVALLSSSSANAFASDQSLTNSVIERMKADAAKAGANGILLQGMGDRVIGSTGTGVVMPNTHMVIGSSTNNTAKQASAVAIYVVEQ